jgi:hypothetical protein
LGKRGRPEKGGVHARLSQVEGEPAKGDVLSEGGSVAVRGRGRVDAICVDDLGFAVGIRLDADKVETPPSQSREDNTLGLKKLTWALCHLSVIRNVNGTFVDLSYDFPYHSEIIVNASHSWRIRINRRKDVIGGLALSKRDGPIVIGPHDDHWRSDHSQTKPPVRFVSEVADLDQENEQWTYMPIQPRD